MAGLSGASESSGLSPFFADDSLVFLENRPHAARALLDILRTYESASIQKVNLSKSAVLFSPSIASGSQEAIKRILGVWTCLTEDRYFGFPLMLGRQKVGQFEFLVERVKERLASWKVATLSHAGRALMIK